jgi:hypothetical protein
MMAVRHFQNTIITEKNNQCDELINHLEPRKIYERDHGVVCEYYGSLSCAGH